MSSLSYAFPACIINITMSKAALSIAEKLAQLRHIPNSMLPATLKHKILLPKLTEIRVEANRNAKELGPVLNFYRKYIADLRLHNPHLKITREITEMGPLAARVSLRKGESAEAFIIEGGKCKTAEDLKNKILEYHNGGE